MHPLLMHGSLLMGMTLATGLATGEPVVSALAIAAAGLTAATSAVHELIEQFYLPLPIVAVNGLALSSWLFAGTAAIAAIWSLLF
jgi:hypothetical protein